MNHSVVNRRLQWEIPTFRVHLQLELCQIFQLFIYSLTSLDPLDSNDQAFRKSFIPGVRVRKYLNPYCVLPRIMAIGRCLTPVSGVSINKLFAMRNIWLGLNT